MRTLAALSGAFILAVLVLAVLAMAGGGATL